MALETTNLDTLQRKGLLLNNPITLNDNTTVIFVNFSSDPNTNMFILETSLGDIIPMRNDTMGTVNIAGFINPSLKNGGERTKLKKLK